MPCPPDELTCYPGFLLSWTGRLSASRMREALAPLGLHPRDFGVLAALSGASGTSQQELGRALGVDPSTMVAVLDELERRSLVARSRRSDDRRAYALTVTAAGDEALAAGRRAAERLQRELLAPLEPAERDELTRLLSKLATAS